MAKRPKRRIFFRRSALNFLAGRQPAKICLDWRKNLSPLGIPPIFKQGLISASLICVALASFYGDCLIFLGFARRSLSGTPKTRPLFLYRSSERPIPHSPLLLSLIRRRPQGAVQLLPGSISMFQHNLLLTAGGCNPGAFE